MELHVFFAVLAAAALHAGWNAVIKVSNDAFLSLTVIGVCGGLVAIPLVAVFGFPIAAAWPWLIASVIIHLGYYIFLSEAYRTGDLGAVYPIARGVAPMLTTLVGVLFLNERVSPGAAAGIVFVIAGVMMLSLARGEALKRLDRRALAFALGTACTVSAYTFADGYGGRISGNAHAYASALFVVDGAFLGLFAFWRRGRAVTDAMAYHWKPGLLGGAMSLAAYWIAIWAMSVAPIPMVATLRETSVLFAALIATYILREGFHWARIAAAVVVVAGVGLIRFG
ncbi:MAG: SMR family transporter [Beijerinckiaceae bacterium]